MLPRKPSEFESLEAPRWRIGVDRRRAGVYVVLALAAGFVCGYLSGRYAPREENEIPTVAPIVAEAAPKNEAAVTGRVLRVVRGDVIEVENAGAVRLLGVETPDGRPQYGEQGKRALAFVEQKLAGQNVRLEFDPANAARQHRNEAGELLAYVFASDGRLFNAELLQAGHGFAKIDEPFMRQEEFRAYEREAMHAMRGLWGLSETGGEKVASAASPERSRLAPLDPSAIGPNLPALSNSQSPAAPASDAVYVDVAERIYHKAGCQDLGKKRAVLSLNEARDRGFTACGRCFASTVLKAK